MNIAYVGKTGKPIRTYPYHMHPFPEVLLCLDGTGTCIIGEKEYDFSPGKLFLIPPDTPHSKVSENGYTDASLMLRDFKGQGDRLIITEDDSSGTARRLFDLIIEAFYRSYSDRLYADTLASAMYQFVCSRGSRSHSLNAAVDRFKTLLADRFSDPDFDLPAAMKNTGYSVNYFRTLFEQQTGETPADYLQRLRMEYAKQQLAGSSGKVFIRTVAFQSGFSDPYYFSRIFRKREGISPREYLNLNGEKHGELLTELLKDQDTLNRTEERHQLAAANGMEELVPFRVEEKNGK